MKTLGNGPWAREVEASARAGAGKAVVRAPAPFDGKRSNASPGLDALGRFSHPCIHPGCGAEGAFGQGADLGRYVRAAEKGEADAVRWLGRWWCRAHVPEGFLPRPSAPVAAVDVVVPREPETVRRQVKNGQGVLL